MARAGVWTPGCQSSVMHRSRGCHRSLLASAPPHHHHQEFPMRRRAWLLAPAATLAFLAGCATTTPPRTIADTAAATPQLSTLNRLVQDAGLADMLQG